MKKSIIFILVFLLTMVGLTIGCIENLFSPFKVIDYSAKTFFERRDGHIVGEDGFFRETPTGKDYIQRNGDGEISGFVDYWWNVHTEVGGWIKNVGDRKYDYVTITIIFCDQQGHELFRRCTAVTDLPVSYTKVFNVGLGYGECSYYAKISKVKFEFSGI